MSKDHNTAYRVLARKYRPQNFAQLIGQDALVRTLTNAITSDRIAHAFMLTGVRGVGKTTTARIIARALNYTGPDGKSGPTTGPTDDCSVCQAIAEGRHTDVIEIDGASNNGVSNIREILDNVRYAPAEARYKIYIIDEVHMLSTAAFNALLKTLEEPPPHVKFILATTEIRKVPVTVLSRCQRFDLKRVDAETLAKHYTRICGEERIDAEDEAIAMIARAADGSVRDGLSILDQAMALGGGKITAQQVRDMMGLADRARLLDLFEKAMQGDCNEALAIMADLYRSGADPLSVVQDLLDITHLLSKFQAVPDKTPTTVEPNMASVERNRAVTMAKTLSVPALTRVWQILLKGLSEVQYAPNPQAATEMVLIRLAYASELPDPASLLKDLANGTVAVKAPSAAPRASSGGGSTMSMVSSSAPTAAVAPKVQESREPVAVANNNLETVQDLHALLQTDGSLILANQVYNYVQLVKIQSGVVEFVPAPNAPSRLAQDLGKKLQEITNQRWMVVSAMPGTSAQPTLSAQAEAQKQQILDEVKRDPVVARVLALFPGTEIISVTENKDEPS